MKLRTSCLIVISPLCSFVLQTWDVIRKGLVIANHKNLMISTRWCCKIFPRKGVVLYVLSIIWWIWWIKLPLLTHIQLLLWFKNMRLCTTCNATCSYQIKLNTKSDWISVISFDELLSIPNVSYFGHHKVLYIFSKIMNISHATFYSF